MLFVAIWLLFQIFHRTSAIMWGVFFLALLPKVTAAETPFPQLKFQDFSTLVLNNFGPDITLSTVLTLLLSMTANTELLNLHSAQKYSTTRVGTSWMRAFANILIEKLKVESMLEPFEVMSSAYTNVTTLSRKLDTFAAGLNLLCISQNRTLEKPLPPVSHKAIEPVHVICPLSPVCMTLSCHSSSLAQNTRYSRTFYSPTYSHGRWECPMGGGSILWKAL
ncbi:hypothetical protein BDN72DRAFT_782483 [Pluteus cervinus]|uniref:Uncharacterized protein n=1 Tax=Pluteus cervinus TaxID=181527 RepID=A0ACD2ZXS6_9AGAR|nr:hypothetical protein BDN72DRAFT_782483 [Pluteus cervinus]